MVTRIVAVTEATNDGKGERFDIAKFDNSKLSANAAGGAVGAMRAIRFVVAALTALALAALPLSAGVAKLPAAKADVAMSTPDHACLGADAGYDHAADVCSLKCCGTAAILVEAPPLAGLRRMSASDMVAPGLTPFTLPPDPPPPRS